MLGLKRTGETLSNIDGYAAALATVATGFIQTLTAWVEYHASGPTCKSRPV